MKRRAALWEIKEDHLPGGFWMKREMAQYSGYWLIFMGEKSKLMCQTAFSHQRDVL